MLNFIVNWYIIMIYQLFRGILIMSNATEFEMRRRERRRRERLRKKRIRAAIIFIVLIAIIIVVAVAVSMKKGNNEQQNTNNVSIETTENPENVVPTVEPVQTSTLNIPPATEESNLLQIVEDSVQEKRCYLTFDDGPTENITPQILDTLRKYNIKATFFEVGSLIDSNFDMARRVYEEGHLIANHSDGHNYEKLYASTDTFINEVNACFQKIDAVTGGTQTMKLVRFPGGSYKSSADSFSPVKQECKAVVKENGYYYCDWNALNGDAEGKKKDAQGLLDYLKSNMPEGQNVVILMHDASAKQTTADALPMIIEYLISEGYTFHRLDDINYQAAVTTIAPESGETATTTTSTDTTNTTSPTSTTNPTADTSNVQNSNTQSATDEPAQAQNTQNVTPAPAQSGTAIIIQ